MLYKAHGEHEGGTSMKRVEFEIDGYKVAARAVRIDRKSYKIKCYVLNKQDVPPVDHHMLSIIKEMARQELWNDIHYPACHFRT